MGLLYSLKAGYEAFKNEGRSTASNVTDDLNTMDLCDAKDVAAYKSIVNSRRDGKGGSADETRAAAEAKASRPLVRVLGALCLLYVVLVDVPFTESQDPLLKVAYFKLLDARYANEATVEDQIADAKRRTELAIAKMNASRAEAQLGALSVAQRAGGAYLTGESRVSIDQIIPRFGRLIQSQISISADHSLAYKNGFAAILKNAIDVNGDGFLEAAEAKGLADSDPFIQLIEGLPMTIDQKAYVASKVLQMSGYK